MLGVERGEVILLDHDAAWEIEAKRTIEVLRSILGNVIYDISHIGSTALPIKAKPIIDIAIALLSLNDIIPIMIY